MFQGKTSWKEPKGVYRGLFKAYFTLKDPSDHFNNPLGVFLRGLSLEHHWRSIVYVFEQFLFWTPWTFIYMWHFYLIYWRKEIKAKWQKHFIIAISIVWLIVPNLGNNNKYFQKVLDQYILLFRKFPLFTTLLKNLNRNLTWQFFL